MSAKHSLAPWRVSERDNGDLVVRDSDDPDFPAGRPVCELWVTTAPRDERDANARLIAAAPELLAALVALVPWLEEQGHGGAVTARRAIAKATGGKP